MTAVSDSDGKESAADDDYPAEYRRPTDVLAQQEPRPRSPLGMLAPSVASLARIFRQAGVARKEPRKKPRSSYRRFVYPAANACWQLDGTA